MKKSKDGYYHGSITLDGKEYHVTGKTIAEVNKKKIQRAKEHKYGIHSKNVLLKLWADRWLANIEINLSNSSYKMYSYTVDKINDFLGDIPVQKIRQDDVQNLITKWQHQPRTCQVLKLTMNRIMEYAIDNDLIVKNPVRNIQLPVYKAKEKRALNDIELKAIRTAAFTDEEHLLVSLLYNTGMRIGEILALSRASIDLNNRIIKVEKSLAFNSNRGYLKEPKTKNSKRDIPINNSLYNVLKSYQYDLYLFTRDGQIFSKQAYRRLWESIIKKMNQAVIPKGSTLAPINNLTAHMFRHNYATMLYNSNINVKEAQKLLGHSSITVTMDIYTHLDKKFNQDVLDKLNNIAI